MGHKLGRIINHYVVSDQLLVWVMWDTGNDYDLSSMYNQLHRQNHGMGDKNQGRTQDFEIGGGRGVKIIA
jgi:hypothetical protein